MSEAYAQKRVIHTKNGKDFLPVRFNKMYGLIVVEGNFSNEAAYLNALDNIVVDLVPYADNFLNTHNGSVGCLGRENNADRRFMSA